MPKNKYAVCFSPDIGPLGDIQNDAITIYKNDQFHTSNFHIQHVKVFTGNDDYELTDACTIEAKDGALFIGNLGDTAGIISGRRLRSEPGVQLEMESEEGEKLIINIGHHKGSVYVRTEIFDKDNR